MSYHHDLADHYSTIHSRLWSREAPKQAPKQEPKRLGQWHEPRVYEATTWVDITTPPQVSDRLAVRFKPCKLPKEATDKDRIVWSIQTLTGLSAVKIQDVIRVVGAAFNLSYTGMLTRRRNKRFCEPRQMAMAVTAEITRQSYPQIARAFGNYDHTTVLHAHTKYRHLIAEALRECQFGD